jgi:NADH:ubiquinone oxidoreductase subunit E
MTCACETQVDPKLIKKFISTIGADATATIPLLQAVQSQYGYLPRSAFDMIVQNTEISGSQLYGVATFYAQFRLKPLGRHLIRVCHGTACHVRGADKVNTSVRHTLKMGEKDDTAADGSYTIEDVACVGCCSLAPVMLIDEEVHGEQTGATAERNLKKHMKEKGENSKS